MISIIIPMHNKHEFTDRCIELLLENADKPDELDIIVVDNNSSPAYKAKDERVYVTQCYDNIGVLNLYKLGMEYIYADSEIIIWMHNDVYIWEQGFDTRIHRAFYDDQLLGMAGLFGGRGVSADGGRGWPESNMQGKEIGAHGSQHGYHLTGQHPAVIFDSLCLIFPRDALEDVGIDDRIPPHFWYDRIIPLDFIRKGWRCATIGIAHDHAGGTTSCSVPMDNWRAVYDEGHRLFLEKHGDILNDSPLWIDENYNYNKNVLWK